MAASLSRVLSSAVADYGYIEAERFFFLVLNAARAHGDAVKVHSDCCAQPNPSPAAAIREASSSLPIAPYKWSTECDVRSRGVTNVTCDCDKFFALSSSLVFSTSHVANSNPLVPSELTPTSHVLYASHRFSHSLPLHIHIYSHFSCRHLLRSCWHGRRVRVLQQNLPDSRTRYLPLGGF